MLSPQTQKLVDEVFANQICCRCKEPAVRFRKKGFYCQQCYHDIVEHVQVHTAKMPRIRKMYSE